LAQIIYAIGLILLAPFASCDPILAALFTPARPLAGRYEVCVVDGARPDGYQYGDSERLEPLDAFGAAGTYDRAKLAQLYAGRRVTMTRGWRHNEGRFESITLLSPYPDATLSRLNDGTLSIRWIEER
jgi:hypothetical protein